MKKHYPILLTSFLLLYLTGAGLADQAIHTGRLRTAKSAKWVPTEIIVKFKDRLSEDHINRINQRHGTSVLHTSPFAGFKRLSVPAGKTSQQMVELYSSDPEVEYAELNYYAYAHFVPNDPYYTYQWHLYETYAGVNIEPAWDITTGDPNVIVAVLDTGVAYENYKGFELAPDLVNTRFVPGYDFVNDDTHPNDDDAHGTHVTGTIAQSTNNGLGAAGIAFNCSIMPVKVLNRRGEAPYTTVAEGVYFAADNGANIINLSLGGPDDSITLRDAVAYAYNHGVTIICSAGNEYELGNPTMYPAAYNQYCIAVGATRYDRTRAYYSNTGSYLDLAAPGGDLNVDQNGDGYGDGILQQTFGASPKDWGYWFYTGTSMAAPHVSGIAALLISTGITGPDAVREALQNTAADLGPAGWDAEYGWGLVDAYAALNYYQLLSDFNGDGFVDYKDLRIFAQFWLTGESFVDIAPEGGDGLVNLLDFARFALDW
jgi:serine protease